MVQNIIQNIPSKQWKGTSILETVPFYFFREFFHLGPAEKVPFFVPTYCAPFFRKVLEKLKLLSTAAFLTT